jgi:hypothetical protein
MSWRCRCRCVCKGRIVSFSPRSVEKSNFKISESYTVVVRDLNVVCHFPTTLKFHASPPITPRHFSWSTFWKPCNITKSNQINHTTRPSIPLHFKQLPFTSDYYQTAPSPHTHITCPVCYVDHGHCTSSSNSQGNGTING